MTGNKAEKDALERGLGLKEAVALNMIEMVGIGPFVVIPLVIKAMGGPQALLAWVAGAVLALLDGFVWSELGAAMPLAGGSYVFLREAYGPGRFGRLMSFLFVWQTLIQAPLSLASGAIGFSQYASYLHPLGKYGEKAVSGALVIVLVALLYRRITSIGKISMLLWVGVIGTILWLIWGGATHFNPRLVFTYAPGTWNFSWLFFAGLGSATINTIYTYWGYYNICHLGGEIREPEKPKDPPKGDITGKWKLSYTTPEGPEDSTLDVMMASDGSLSGTLSGTRGTFNIISGYLSADKFSFTINILIEGSPADVLFSGTFEGTTMKGSISVQGLDIDFTGTKPGVRASIAEGAR